MYERVPVVSQLTNRNVRVQMHSAPARHEYAAEFAAYEWHRKKRKYKEKGKNMNYQWYPGHMTKAVRMMQEDIKLIDLVIEIVDARIPVASRNPDIQKLAAQKGRLILLNKSDLADKKANEAWMQFYKEQGITALLIDSRNGIGLKEIQNAVRVACREKLERDRKKGIQNRPLRAMVAGIPNVGKSTFINSYAKKACAKTGNKPGVTKGKQWIRLDKTLELLDTPGILWPKFEDKQVGLHLAMVGSINDEILDPQELAIQTISFLEESYPGSLRQRYGLEGAECSLTAEDETEGKNLSLANEEGLEGAAQVSLAAHGEKTERSNLEQEEAGLPGLSEEKEASYDILKQIAKKRGCLGKGGSLDLEKASAIVIDEFRSGKLGRITIESP